LAFSLVVNVEEGAEMSVLDGDRGPEPVDEMGLALKGDLRNYGNESNYAYGIKEGFPRVADLLDRTGIPATFTCAALALERAPQIAAFIRERGHEAASHGYRWVHQFRMEEDDERAFLRRAKASIADSVGEEPVGHLSRYLLTERTRRLLVEEGFGYHMDDYSGDEPFWDTTASGPIVVLPYAVDSNDMKLWAEPSYTPEQWLAYAIRTFDELYAERREGFRMMSLGVHLRIIGRPGRIWALRELLAHVQRHDDVWCVRRRDLAEAFAAAHPAPR
jgi:peptidoglycan/xylan/chitin deacetylase (PgdA/CDA1 family)